MNDSVHGSGRPKPYVGVTGFTTADEVHIALASFQSKSHQLMVGVLASGKTLRGEKTRYPGRYPLVGDIARIFVERQDVVSLVHYATDELETLGAQVRQLHELVGPVCDGYQLNACWPDPRQVAEVSAMSEVLVLQVGARAMEQVGRAPRTLAERLDVYAESITHVLVDPSGGRGVPFEPALAVDLLLAVRERHPHLGLGIAGGLSAESMHLAAAVAARVPSLSIDAEGRLRDEADELRLDEVKRYLEAASRALAAGVRDA